MVQVPGEPGVAQCQRGLATALCVPPAQAHGDLRTLRVVMFCKEIRTVICPDYHLRFRDTKFFQNLVFWKNWFMISIQKDASLGPRRLHTLPCPVLPACPQAHPLLSCPGPVDFFCVYCVILSRLSFAWEKATNCPSSLDWDVISCAGLSCSPLKSRSHPLLWSQSPLYLSCPSSLHLKWFFKGLASALDSEFQEGKFPASCPPFSGLCTKPSAWQVVGTQVILV